TRIMLWGDKLKAALTSAANEERAERLIRTYGNAFPVGYTNRTAIDDAVRDIETLEYLRDHGETVVDLKELDSGGLSLKIFSQKLNHTLSDILPTLEHMGLKTIEEHPFALTPAGSLPVKMREIITVPVRPLGGEFEALKASFEATLLDIWSKTLEDD